MPKVHREGSRILFGAKAPRKWRNHHESCWAVYLCMVIQGFLVLISCGAQNVLHVKTLHRCHLVVCETLGSLWLKLIQKNHYFIPTRHTSSCSSTCGTIIQLAVLKTYFTGFTRLSVKIAQYNNSMWVNLILKAFTSSAWPRWQFCSIAT